MDLMCCETGKKNLTQHSDAKTGRTAKCINMYTQKVGTNYNILFCLISFLSRDLRLVKRGGVRGSIDVVFSFGTSRTCFNMCQHVSTTSLHRA